MVAHTLARVGAVQRLHAALVVLRRDDTRSSAQVPDFAG